MLGKIILITMVFLSLIITPCFAQGPAFVCPVAIYTENISTSIKGNDAHAKEDKKAYKLIRMGLYSGAPEQLIELKPDNEDDNPPTWKWLDTNKEDIVVSCDYEGGFVQLNNVLTNIKTCTAYTKDNKVELICE